MSKQEGLKHKYNVERVGCFDCGLHYGNNRFQDLIIPLDIWKRISPTGDEGGLLCPSCICARLCDAGISGVPAAFMSGPIDSIDRHTMQAYRMTKNERLARERAPSAKEARMSERLMTPGEQRLYEQWCSDIGAVAHGKDAGYIMEVPIAKEAWMERARIAEQEKAELLKLAENLRDLEAKGRKPSIANQGQAMDGFSLLAHYRALADRARAILAKHSARDEQENGDGY